MRTTLPAMLLGLVVLAGFSSLRGRWPSPWGARAEAHGSPNVLLIVLDTVRADHLSLHGYDRPTTPHLEALGKRGVVFRQAHAAAPWTFPSHASLFTGRWPYEVLAGHDVPLDALAPTLAEVLASRGYDTVGVVGNLGFCSYYTGLDRGFRTYSDIPLTFLGALATTELGDHLLGALDDVITLANPAVHHPSLKSFRKDADRVNREFLDWLDHGRHPGRPFFAFLNYFDAHDPYIVPPGGDHRFGHRPRTELERRLLETWWFWPKKLEITPEQYEALRDGYDSCLAYLDDRLGRLLGELERRGELRETLVLITSDHGEAFGEHGLFSHGGSLYQDQLHVPLLIVGPDPLVPAGRTIDALISTRDLAATVVDLLGLDSGPAPLPGRSLARFWNDNDSPTPADSGLLALATVEGGGTFLPNGPLSPVFNGRMIGLINKKLFKYILIIGSSQFYEEIYAIDVDPAEQTDLAGMESMRPTLQTFRQQAAAILLGKDTHLVHADRSPDRRSPVQAGPVVR